MFDKVEIKTRIKGNIQKWEEMDCITADYCTLNKTINVLLEEHENILEFRWNYVGSQQGHYHTGNARRYG